jgi:parallel beta-helix repeat protein
MYCHDARHTGRIPYSTADTEGIEKWRFATDNDVCSGSPIIDKKGIIYVGASDMFAVYPNGTMKWMYKTDGIITSAPALDENGILYFAAVWGSNLHAMYSNNATVKWKYKIGETWASPTIGEDGIIYAPATDNFKVHAVYPNGTGKWIFKAAHRVYSSPAIGEDGTIYCTSYNGNLYALYPENGTEIWKYKVGSHIRTSPCIADDGTIYTVSTDGPLFAFNPDGTVKWNSSSVGGGTSPTTGQDGTIYCGYGDLHAVNPVNGSIKWICDLGIDVKNQSPFPIPSGNTLYVGGTGEGNYTKIQDAIDDARDGDTVYVYSGIYFENIIINTSIVLQGEDEQTTVIDGSGIDDVVNVTCDLVNISGFTIQNGYDGIHIYSSNVTIFNNIIMNNSHNGTICALYQSVIIKNNVIENNGYRGLYCYKSKNLVIQKNIFNFNFQDCIIESSHFCKFYDNTIINRGFSSSIWIFEGGDNIINGNILSNVGGLLIYNSQRNIIKNNTLFNCTAGILLHTNVSNCIVSENYIKNPLYDGILVFNFANQNVISNNIVINSELDGIRIGAYNGELCSDNIIKNNTIYNCNWSGIILDFTSILSTVSGNIVYNNNISGVAISCERNQVFNNRIFSNNQSGILLYFSKWGNNISKNYIFNNKEYGGIIIVECENNVLYKNNIENNTQGIEMRDSNNNDIICNNFINNNRDAYFLSCKKNNWEFNYWNRARLFPKFILGRVGIIGLIPWFNIDWNPAKEPYDI